MIRRKNYAVLDTETTGLNNNPEAEIIEIGCVALDKTNLSQIGTFESYIKPEKIDLDKPLPEWTQSAFNVNKIDLEVLKKAHDPKKVCDKFIGFLKQLDKPLIVAQNAGFDMYFIRKWFELCGKNFDDYIFNPVIDLYAFSYMFWSGHSGMTNMKLETVSKAFGIEHTNAHSALGDAKPTAEIFKRFYNFMNQSDLLMGQNKSDISDKKEEKKVFKTDFYRCPNCGGTLKVRTAKYGRNAGNKFAGCENYFPNKKCTFTCNVTELKKYKV